MSLEKELEKTKESLIKALQKRDDYMEEVEILEQEIEDLKSQIEGQEIKICALDEIISELVDRKDKLQFYNYEFTKGEWMEWLEKIINELKEVGE